MRILQRILFFLLLVLIPGCKDYSTNEYLLKEYYYCYNAYRTYPLDLTVDTFKYLFKENDTLQIIGYRYETIDDIKYAIKDTTYKKYSINNKSINVYPFPVTDFELTYNPIIGFSDYTEWRINAFDKNKLVVTFYNYKNEKLSSDIELYAIKY